MNTNEEIIVTLGRGEKAERRERERGTCTLTGVISIQYPVPWPIKAFLQLTHGLVSCPNDHQMILNEYPEVQLYPPGTPDSWTIVVTLG